jgi:crotonobetainyl-CoA:carnitine CoA-transferase CaiB-like acyl-CoA transferase
MTAPLSAIKVIEIGTLIAAPFAARMLAEFGAEVIKKARRCGGTCNHATRNPWRSTSNPPKASNWSSNWPAMPT